ncbi:MAG: hypothetical protein NC485_12405 [Ruminococcus flavefaciens]|nr:hypothetical protein [Ruminococcus flavefaciens]MCM1060121.1 hypothetical protein [Eubacterium sp.]
MGKANIQKQLQKLVASKMKMSSGETLQDQLSREVRRLYDCIQRRINDYYDSYEPKIYRRTYNFRKAMYAEDLIDAYVEGNQIKLSVRFHDSFAYHPNFDNSHDSYVPILMNYGWNAPKLEKYIGHPVDRFTRFEGAFFIENGILDWNHQNKLGITIDVTSIYNGRRFNYF